MLVITAAYSRFVTGRMIPIRKTEDLLLASWALIQQLGRHCCIEPSRVAGTANLYCWSLKTNLERGNYAVNRHKGTP